MCEWYRRNYACGHHFTGASEWCYRYSQTQKRCKVVVTQVDYDSSVCKSCMKKGVKTEVPWEHMIDRFLGVLDTLFMADFSLLKLTSSLLESS
ncbi:hypothetical protein HER10_EVM0013191 [Colletotrichum scovillei]|uniref:uncharacterized protein n=1 Tax=Colletotrichum scovillei TaxID=1209932 RepID=UPI0015C3E735|nr:uncharacterized protein HER10_EVM0013191 [Colletotrichum scovillei]KAF4774456.1 hypothetical protein HER10_EVM0013191 [Colletotrichum scovillei]